MPVKPSTRLDYGKRVARAMALLTMRLDDPPGLEALAAAAAFSPYHFHRIYRELVGETPAETLARARLSRAAVELLRTALPIARIARRAGFASVAGFTRAFRAAHGVPPGAYRGRGGLAPPAPALTKESKLYEVTIRHEPALRLAAIRHVGPYHAIGGVFDRLTVWAGARGIEPNRWLGLYHDDPATVPEAACRADAAIVVGPEVMGEEEVQIIELPAARVAALRFQGPYAELEAAYGWLYGTWLPASGEEPADRPALEDYLNDPREVPPPALLTDILLPLREPA